MVIFQKNKIRSIDVQMPQANESQATDKTNQIKYQNFRNNHSIMRQNIQKTKKERPTKDMTAKNNMNPEKKMVYHH